MQERGHTRSMTAWGQSQFWLILHAYKSAQHAHYDTFTPANTMFFAAIKEYHTIDHQETRILMRIAHQSRHPVPPAHRETLWRRPCGA